MEIKKALFISQEISPYLPASSLADYGRLVAQGVLESGVEVRTFMPKYAMINERRNQLHEVIRLSGMNIIIDDTDHPLIIKVATLQPTRMQVYFMDNDDYFERHTSAGLEVDIHSADNDERSMFFVRGSVETVKKLRWDASVVHCTGWLTALAPLYLRHKYKDDPTFRTGRIVMSLIPDRFDGSLDARLRDKLIMEGFEPEQLAVLGAQPVDYATLMRIAIDNSDALVEALPGVDPEVLDYARASGKPLLSCGADPVSADAVAEFYTTL